MINRKFKEESILFEMGRSSVFIDKLSVVSGLKVGKKVKIRLMESIMRMASDQNYTVEKNVDPINKYEFAFVIRDKTNYKRMMRFDIAPKKYIGVHKRPKHHLRIDTSPQHFSTDQYNKMFEWLALDKNIGFLIKAILYTSKVTRIDIALDLYDVLPSDFYIDLHDTYSGGGHVGRSKKIVSWRIGGMTSKRILTAYGKDFLTGTIDHNKLTGTRFEFRVRPGCYLRDLATLGNPFCGMGIYPSGLTSDERLPRTFRTLLNFFPVSTVINLVDDRNEKERIKRVLSKYRTTPDTDLIWKQWDKCISKLQVFSSASVDPGDNNKIE